MVGYSPSSVSRWLVVLLVLGVCSKESLAQPQSGDNTLAIKEGLRTEGAAFRWSLFGTLAPAAAGIGVAATGPTDQWATYSVVLISTGLIVGPSLGHFYAGQNKYGWITLAARAAVGGGLGAVAIAQCPEFEGCTDAEETRMAVFLISGIVLVGASAIYDIVAAPRSARKTNSAFSRLTLIPVLVPGGRIGIAGRLNI